VTLFASATSRIYGLGMSNLRCVLLILAGVARFSLESDADLDRIPRAYVDGDLGRMRCSENRCAALVGEVGISTACAIYSIRPDVCRACLPGDDSCKMARRHFNF
jgi:Fe-S-cluster containining protein